MMDHNYIEQEHIVDRYLMGKLSPSEADSFEEHYVSCKQCLDALEVAEIMQRGMKQVAAEDRAASSRPRLGLYSLGGPIGAPLEHWQRPP